jgi:serine/threonine protein phosphatase PrpC
MPGPERPVSLQPPPGRDPLPKAPVAGEKPQKQELLKAVQKRSSLELVARMAYGKETLDRENPLTPTAPLDTATALAHVGQAAQVITDFAFKQGDDGWQEWEDWQKRQHPHWEQLTDEEKEQFRITTYANAQARRLGVQLYLNGKEAMEALAYLGMDTSADFEPALAGFIEQSISTYFSPGVNSAEMLVRDLSTDKQGQFSDQLLVTRMQALAPLLTEFFGREERAYNALHAVADAAIVLHTAPQVIQPDFLKAHHNEISLGSGTVEQKKEEQILDFLAGKSVPGESAVIETPLASPNEGVSPARIEPTFPSEQLLAVVKANTLSLSDGALEEQSGITEEKNVAVAPAVLSVPDTADLSPKQEAQGQETLPDVFLTANRKRIAALDQNYWLLLDKGQDMRIVDEGYWKILMNPQVENNFLSGKDVGTSGTWSLLLRKQLLAEQNAMRRDDSRAVKEALEKEIALWNVPRKRLGQLRGTFEDDQRFYELEEQIALLRKQAARAKKAEKTTYSRIIATLTAEQEKTVRGSAKARISETNKQAVKVYSLLQMLRALPVTGESQRENQRVIVGIGQAEAPNLNQEHPTMQDRSVVIPNFGGRADRAFFGVYDGHGKVEKDKTTQTVLRDEGRQAADYIADHLHETFRQAREAGKNPQEAWSIAYQQTDKEIVQSGLATGGAAVATAFLEGTNLYVANAGDARIVLVHAGGHAEQLTRDHKVGDAGDKTQERILKDGGVILALEGSPRLYNRENGAGGLNLTRSIGDAQVDDIVSAEPEVKGPIPLTVTHQWLILACDGIWDVIHKDEVAGIIGAETDPQQVSQFLVKEAKKRDSRDNLSVIAVKLQISEERFQSRLTLPIRRNASQARPIPPGSSSFADEEEGVLLETTKRSRE